MVVGSCRRSFDQLFVIGAGDPSNASPRRTLGTARDQFRILRRLHHGSDVPSTALHRKHNHRCSAGRSRIHLEECRAHDATVGDRARSQPCRHAFRSAVLHLRPRASDGGPR